MTSVFVRYTKEIEGGRAKAEIEVGVTESQARELRSTRAGRGKE